MPTIDATVGGSSSNSYATVNNADTYFDERLQSSNWTGEDADDKARALIMATRRLDSENFEGVKNTDGQALKWPRINATDDDGEEFASDSIPTIVEHATYELALHYLNENADSSDPLAPTGLEKFDEAKVGPLEVKVRHAYDAGELPDTIKRLLSPVLQTAPSSGHLLRA